MPSEWINSGIDWSNTQKNRYDDVVRHIYLATDERHRVIGNLNNGTPYSSFSYINYYRTENQLKFIMNTISGWLSPNKLVGDNNVGRVVGKNVFTDFSTVDYGLDISDSSSITFNPSGNIISNSINVSITSPYADLGISSYDSKQGGVLETLLGRDLSFLRDYPNIQPRITPTSLETIYQILLFLKHVRCYRVINNGSEFSLSAYDFRGGISDRDYLQSSSGTGQDTPSECYDSWVSNDSSSYNPRQIGYNQYAEDRDTTDRYRLHSGEWLLKTDMTGEDGNQYTAHDFEFMNLFNKYNTGLANIPSLGLVNGLNLVSDEKGTYGTSSVKYERVFPFPNEALQDFPATGDPYEEVVSEVIGMPLPAMNINKGGFLRYYTEEDGE